MAGRLYIPSLDLARLLPRLRADSPLVTSPNLAPRRHLSAIRLAGGQLHLDRLFWGLTPPWLEVLDHAPHCARLESLSSRPMFREAFHARRCLVPVGGVYIWKSQPRAKQPFLVTRVDRGPLLLAGIWCRFHTSVEAYTDSLALITLPSRAPLDALTDRLPASISPDRARHWLDTDTSPEAARELIADDSGELLGAFPVSRRVNSPAQQDPACAHPLGPMIRATS